MIEIVTLGDDLTVSAVGFGAMALTPVYGEVDDDRVARHAAPQPRPRRHVHRHRQRLRRRRQRAAHRGLLADRRDEVTLATKFGIVGNPAAGEQLGCARRRRLRPAEHRREPGAPPDRRGRPLLHAPARPDGADRGDRRRDGRTGRRRQGPPSRAVRGDRRRVARRGRASTPSPPCRANGRSGAATSRRNVVPAAAELGVGFVPYSPLGRGFLTGHRPVGRRPGLGASDFRRKLPTVLRRGAGGQPRGGRHDPRRRRRHGRPPRHRSPWPGCATAPTSSGSHPCRFPARGGPRASRKTSARWTWR